MGPTLTPTSMANTRAGCPVTIGTRASVAGRLFSTFESTAATAAMARSEINPWPFGVT